MKYIGKWYYTEDLGNGQNLFVVLEDDNNYLVSYYYEDNNEYAVVWYYKKDISLSRIRKQKLAEEQKRLILDEVFEG